MIPVDAARCADYLFVARRNNSLSSADRQRVFRLVFAASIGISVCFTALGAWPVLPFAGLEMVVLYAAFQYVDRHAADYECLEIRGDRLKIEARVGADVQTVEFNRHWAQVVTRHDAGRRRLALRSHGREVEFGRHLTTEDRERIARELHQQLGNRP
jgi:uncharacterized membrane protein